METIKYRQTDRFRRRIFIIVYFGLFAACVAYAFTSDAVIDLINSSYKLGALIASVLFIPPLLLLPKLTSYGVTVKFDGDRFTIEGKSRPMLVRYTDISAMYLNRTKPGELELRNRRGDEIFTFWTIHDGSCIDDIVGVLRGKIAFETTKTTVKSRGGHYPSIAYVRKSE